MILGVDFDNTIVGYDRLFHAVAVERDLIPGDTEVSKNAVRDHLRGVGKENDWTELQGFVYGLRMSEADPIPGAMECLTQLLRRQIRIFIISHKTRHPYCGPKYDLHNAAWQWLEQQGFFEPSGMGLTKDAVFFETTKLQKLARIASVGCTHFIDDLPEILTDSHFPGECRSNSFRSKRHNQCAKPLLCNIVATDIADAFTGS